MLSPQFKPSAGKAPASAKPIAAYFVAEDLKLPAAAKGAASAMKGAGFKGKANETLVIPGTPYMVLVGVGAGKELTALKAAEAGGSAVGAALSAKRTHVNIVVEAVKGCKLSAAELSANAGYGAKLRSYRFDKYRTVSDKDAVKLKDISIITKDAAKAKKAYAPLNEIAEGVKLTRDVVSEPGNILYPESYANECKKLTKLGVKVEVLSKAQMEKLGMGALLGVAQGSVKEAKMVIMHWNGGKKGDKPVALVGKGVTFDTGGISIKPSNGMEEMKFDMGGSGTVVGTMRALAGRKAKVNVVGVIGCVENMPDGNAQRPGDVVTSMSGQTIEVLNTDAEGRLVLADALWYTQNRFKPKAMVDLATLTGAILVAIGSKRAGLFSNNDKVANTLTDLGLEHNEWMWRFPLAEDYDKTLDCDVADMANISAGREAGSITAAQFLQRFVNNVPWAHLDIAGTAWCKKDSPLAPKGATGYGVRLLNEWTEKYYG